MGQIFAAIAKAVLITLVSTLAAIAVEKVRRYNEDKRENDYHYHDHGWDDSDHW